MDNKRLEELKEIANNLSLFRVEFSKTWGKVLNDFEAYNVMPSKELLLKIEDASILPFLFKNYHLETGEFEKIKNLINREVNQKKINNSLDDDSIDIAQEPIIGENEEEILNIVKDNKPDTDFSIYENVVDALKTNVSIRYDENYHNIDLLNRLIEDKIDFSNIVISDNENNSWLTMVLIAASDREVKKMNPDLIAKIDCVLSEYSYGNNRASKIRSMPSYFEALVSHAEYFYFEDFKNVKGDFSDELIFEAFKKAWNLEKNNLGKYNKLFDLSRKPDLVKLFKSNKYLKEMKEISNNKIVSLWNIDDFLANKKEFLDYLISIRKNYISPVSSSLHSIGSISEQIDWKNTFTVEDVDSVFNKIELDEKKYQRIEINFEENNQEIIRILANIVNVGYLGGNKKMLSVVSRVIDLFEHQYNSGESKIALASLVSSVFDSGVSGSLVQKEEFLYVVKKNDKLFNGNNLYNYDGSLYQGKSALNAIEDFYSPKNANFWDGFLLLKNDLPISSEIKLNYLNALSIDEIQIFKEMGFTSQLDNVSGNVNAEFSVESLKGELFDLSFTVLKSQTYASKIASIPNLISSDEKMETWIHALSRHKAVFAIPIILDAINKNPDLLPKEEALLSALEEYPETRALLPKKDYPSFESFFEQIKEKNKIYYKKNEYSYNEKDGDRIREKAFLDKEYDDLVKKSYIPSDLKRKYIERAFVEKNWSQYHSDSTLSDIYLENIFKSNLTNDEVREVFKIINENTSTNRIGFLINNNNFGEKEATVVLELIKKEILSESYISGVVILEKLAKDSDKKKVLSDVLIRDYPELMLNNNLFYITNEVPVTERVERFKVGMEKADKAIRKNILNNSSGTGIKLDIGGVSQELVDKLRDNDWSIGDKFIINSILCDQVLSNTYGNGGKYMFNAKDLVSFLKQNNKTVTPADVDYLNSISDKIYHEYELGNIGIFKELTDMNYIKKNIAEISEFMNDFNCSDRFKYILSFHAEIPNFKVDYVDFGQEIIKEVNRFNLPKELENNFEDGIFKFLELYPPKEITNFLRISDDNLEPLLNKMGVRRANYSSSSVDELVNQTFIYLLSDAIISNNLSDENKEFLVNTQKMYSLSNSLISDSLLNYKGRDVFLSNDFSEICDRYQKKVFLNNMFTSFDNSIVLDSDDSNNNEFKL